MSGTRAEVVFNGYTSKPQKFKKWAAYSPENYEHLYALLMAENYRLHNNDNEAELYYDRAIRLASMNGFVQDTALAYERAANYYLAKQQKKTARHYILNGIQNIETWGAETVARRWARDYQVHRKLENQSRESLSFDMMTVLRRLNLLQQPSVWKNYCIKYCFPC